VKLAALLMVWELIVLLVEIVVMPLRAPAVETSKAVESICSGELPPPKKIVPVLVPVLRLVLKLELVLMVLAAPLTVRPRVPWSRPAPAFTPTAVTAPAPVTLKLVPVMA
jgi:hypothetical protein